MGLTIWPVKRPNIAGWSIGKKIFFANMVFLLLPLLILAVLLFRTTLAPQGKPAEAGPETVDRAASGLIEASVATSVRNYLRAVAENHRQQIEHARQQGGGSESPDGAAHRQAVVDRLSWHALGASGYIYCIDSQGVVQSHPHAALIGANLLQRDEYRELWSVLREQLAVKHGYLEYSGKEPGDERARPKALYMEYVESWDWIVVAVCYRDEVGRLIDAQEIGRQLAAISQGSSGPDFFLLDGDARLLAHPFAHEQSWVEDRARRIKTVLAAASSHRQQTGRIPWQDPPEQGGQEWVVSLQYIPRFHLTLGGLIAAPEVPAGPLLSLRTFVLAVVVAAIALAAGAALWVHRLLAIPLRRLAGQGQRFEGGCEAAFLVKKFDACLREVRGTAEKLTAEVQRRKSAETFLQLYKQIFDNASEGMVITDGSARILAINQAFTAITGYDQTEVVGQNPRLLKSGQHDHDFYEQMWRLLQEKGSWEGEIWNRRKDGTVYPEWLTISGIRNEQGETVYYFAAFYEIGELKKREKQIAFLAYHDLLTRLPNRLSLEQKLTKSLARAGADGSKVCLLFIDLDNFKNINDVFGHKQGDDLLVQVSQRLCTVRTRDDMLCRVGGDEFILLMDQIDNESLIYLAAGRIQAVLKKPFLLDFKKIYLSASIGISVYPGDGDTPLDLIRSADMAMHKAKREGKNRYALFSREMHDQLYEKVRLENGLRYGLLHREFLVYYQPKVNIATRTTASLEALIRWQKGGKLISPAAFIPVAEESSLIDELCLLVLQETCAFHAVMSAEGVAVPVSVNISPRQFHNLDFVDIVEDLLGRHRLEPRFIEFEITETTAMQDVEHTLRIMQRLRELGIFFSIDDFGTGYSSLGSLNKMPVSTLKIDKQFVDDLEANSGIVATIIAISRQMRLNVVAEGVETEEQLLRLGAMGCHEAQGYYFSPPVPGDTIVRYLLAERSGPVAGPHLL